MRFLASIFLCVCLVGGPKASGQDILPTSEEVSHYSRGIAGRVAYDIENGRLSNRLDEALQNLVKTGIYHMRQKGEEQMAMRMWYEYNERYVNYFYIAEQLHEIPDKYPPLSQWLRDFYNTLEFLLGEPAMRMTRLFDIKVINNCIPVTFCLFGIELNITVSDYEPYFVALAGTITYWVAQGVCIGATWGTGFMFCSPIAWAAENLMEKFLAPRIMNPVYRTFCED